MQKQRAPLAVSCGDPSGVGPDVILKSWLKRNDSNLPAFYVHGDPEQLRARALCLGYDVPIAQTQMECAAMPFCNALPVLPLYESLTESPRTPDKANAKGILESIERAVEHTVNGHASGVVTAPIAKKVLYDAGFNHPGHTEYLADLAYKYAGEDCTPVMMLAGPKLRTIPVTIHIPLHQVPSALSKDVIIETVRIANTDLKSRFELNEPRIALSGLNPHAGENGAMGEEEIEIIIPAIETLRSDGLNVIGPLPADTMFHEAARARYDVAICMYHDQALIPAKALGFDDAVNVTLGLPFIRTSPDHGTAFDLAGTGEAKPDSFIAALKMADKMAKAQSIG